MLDLNAIARFFASNLVGLCICISPRHLPFPIFVTGVIISCQQTSMYWRMFMAHISEWSRVINMSIYIAIANIWIITIAPLKVS